MFIRKSRGAPGALAMLIALALFLVPPTARAADPDDPSGGPDGWRKVISYARCAFLVFVAATPAQWGFAMLDCSRLIADESAPHGGGTP